MPTVVIDPNITRFTRKDFLSKYPNLRIIQPSNDEIDGVLSRNERIAFIIRRTQWDNSYLTHLTEGDWIISTGSGYQTLPLERFEEEGIIFTNSPGINSEPVAEHVFAMALSHTRNILNFHTQQKEKIWAETRSVLTDLAGDTCCVIGLGNIGESVAKRAKAFNMTVHGVKRTTEHYTGHAEQVYKPKHMQQALKGARLVVVCVPHTQSTTDLIGTDEISQTGKQAILVNVSRGPVLNLNEAKKALEMGHLDFLCLDVTDPEPLPSSSPLWNHDKVLITPHCAGTSDEKYPDRFVPYFKEQYDRWCQDKTLKNQPLMS